MEQMQITKTINELMQGQTPELQSLKVQETLNDLQTQSDEALEAMLKDPALSEAANASLREEAMRILEERRGRDYVNALIDGMERTPQASQAQISFDPKATLDKTPAERAREAFKAFNNPLAALVPDNIKSFLMGPDGAFYLELHEGRALSMRDYDLVMDGVITGRMADGVVTDLTGIKGRKQVYTEKVEIHFLGLELSGSQVIITTDHPMASKLQVSLDELTALR